jgi:hypothetical protein
MMQTNSTEMSKQPSKQSDGIVSTETKITAIFVVVALVSAYGTTTVTDSQWVNFAVLIGVGVIAPILVNEWRD